MGPENQVEQEIGTVLNVWAWQDENRRPDWDEFFLMLAELTSTRATCDRGPKQRFRNHRGTGAVIVAPDKRHIAIGYAGSPRQTPHCDEAGHELSAGHCIRTLHAEENAILNATFTLDGSTLYVTTAPCYDCSKRILTVGIQRVVYECVYNSRYMECNVALNLLTDNSVVVEQKCLNRKIETL